MLLGVAHFFLYACVAWRYRLSRRKKRFCFYSCGTLPLALLLFFFVIATVGLMGLRDLPVSFPRGHCVSEDIFFFSSCSSGRFRARPVERERCMI